MHYFIAPCPYKQKRSIELSVAHWSFLQQMGPHLTIPEIAEGLGNSLPMARYYCRQFGIKPKPSTANYRRAPKGVVPKGFKPMVKGGYSPHTSPDGSTRLKSFSNSPRKYPQIKHKGKWVWHHRLLWQQQNGPIPDAHCLICLSGDTTNPDPANWKCVSRSEAVRRQHTPEIYRKVAESQRGLWAIVKDLESRGLTHQTIRHSTAQVRANQRQSVLTQKRQAETPCSPAR